MVDKRALKNEELFDKLEKEIASIVGKYDFKKIEEQNKEVIDDIGYCPISAMNTLEAM